VGKGLKNNGNLGGEIIINFSLVFLMDKWFETDFCFFKTDTYYESDGLINSHSRKVVLLKTIWTIIKIDIIINFHQSNN
jgi:hypothetical protein